MSLPQNEFFEANRGRIEALAQQANTFLDYNPHFVIEGVDRDPGDVDVSYVSGAITAEDYKDEWYEEKDEELPLNYAQELADHMNDNRLRVAAVAIQYLQTRASQYLVYEEIEALDENDEEAVAAFDAQELHFLNFGQALWRRTEATGPNGEAVELTRIQLKGLEHYGGAEQLIIEVADGVVDKRTAIHKIGNQVPIISATTEASANPMLERVYKMFGRGAAFQKLFPIVTVKFKDEEELDNLLSELWGEVQGTAHEEEATPVLDELRIYALAQKQAIHFIAEHSLTQPSDDQFSQLEEVLNGIVG